MAGSPVHGREGILYLSTSTGSTSYGSEVGWVNSWEWSPSKDNAEITALNQNSKYYVEGLVDGSVSAEGSFITGSGGLQTIISRFAKTLINDTDGDTAATAITDGNFYLHLISKPIDTAGTSDDINGAKYVVPVLASGFTAGADGGSIESWSYEGQQNGDVIYVESTSTEAGLPKKSY